MEVFSHYGCGLKAFAIERKADGRVEFTLWVTAACMPIWPSGSWSAYYRGPLRPTHIKEDGHIFDIPVRIERDFMLYARTFTSALLMLAVAFAPAAYMIYRTQHRAATTLEFICVLATCAWPVHLVTWLERRRSRILKQAWTKEA